MTVHKASTITLEPPTLGKLPYGSIPSVTERVFSNDHKEKGTPFNRVSLDHFLWSTKAFNHKNSDYC